MPYDPTLPVDDSLAEASELRNQFNGLKALMDAQAAQIADLQTQLSSLMPMLSRDANGSWTLSYSGAAQSMWQVWARYAGSTNWSNFGEIQTSQFPASDDAMSPGGAWWQVKVCGEDGDNNQTTAFSNVISYGAVPA